MPWAQMSQAEEQVQVLHRRLRRPLAEGARCRHRLHSHFHQVVQIHRGVRRDHQKGAWTTRGDVSHQSRVQTVVEVEVVHQAVHQLHRVLELQLLPGLVHC